MSLSNTTSRIDYTGNGVTTAYVMTNILVYATGDVDVYLDGVIQVAGYTVTGLDLAAGATVTFAVAPASAVKIALLRVVDLTQQTSIGVAGAFPAKTIEKSLDLGVMGTLQQVEVLGRSLKAPAGTTGFSGDIPNPNTAANMGKVLRIKTDGTGIDSVTVDSSSQLAVMTTKGDLAGYSTVVARIPVGTNDQALIADSAQALGLKWASVTALGTLTSHLLFTDATYDIGASGATRPRDLFLSRNGVLGGTLAITGNTTVSGILLLNTAQTTGAVAGSIVLANNIFLYGINAAGTTARKIIGLNASNSAEIYSGEGALHTTFTANDGITLANSAPATPVAKTLYEDSIVKGWVTFQVDGTIDDDLNVSSITDNAAGDWTVNWATAFANATYAPIVAVQADNTSARNFVISPDTNPTTTAVRVLNRDNNAATQADPTGTRVRMYVWAIGNN